MKRIMLLFFLLSFSTSSHCGIDEGLISVATSKSATYYSRYNTREFLAIEKLDQPINFEDTDLELLNATIFHLTNKEREKRKLEPLIYSAALRNAAQLHSEQMRDLKFFSHTNRKRKAFASHTDRIRYFGRRFPFTGENIHKVSAVKVKYHSARNLTNVKAHYSVTPLTYLELARSIVKGWMQSSGHRANILDKDYKYLGCGNALPLSTTSRGRWMYTLSTQNFAGP
mgnify:CR=1 FL=1|jgi:uncharacterized protein YkwD